MSEQIRVATVADVAVLAALADVRREQYARYQPLFWHPADDAHERHRAYLAGLVADDEVITLVSHDGSAVTGFLIGMLTSAPPVYDPGGRTCLIDDFVVAPSADLRGTAVALLQSGLAEARRRGAVQVVVVAAHLDEPRRETLRACGLQIASEWWVTPGPRSR